MSANDKAPRGGFKRRASDHHSRIVRAILDIDPVLSALFYIGFVVAAVFMVIIYSRSLNISASHQQQIVNTKIIAAEVDSCNRTNAIRRTSNQRGAALNTLARAIGPSPNLTPKVRRAFHNLITPPIPVVDCDALAVRLGNKLANPSKLEKP